MTQYLVKLTLTEPMLGTVPKDKHIYETYIQKEARNDLLAAEDDGDPDREAELAKEITTLPVDEEKGWTGFHTLPELTQIDGTEYPAGTLVIYNYVIKGFFKDACGMLRRVRGTRSAKIKAYKKIIDGLVFVSPRMIPIQIPANGKVDVLERPLRAQTMQGERVALARSDTVPAETELHFYLDVVGALAEADLREWLDYGILRGLGQWRNAGWGAFTYSLAEMPA